MHFCRRDSNTTSRPGGAVGVAGVEGAVGPVGHAVLGDELLGLGGERHDVGLEHDAVLQLVVDFLQRGQELAGVLD